VSYISGPTIISIFYAQRRDSPHRLPWVNRLVLLSHFLKSSLLCGVIGLGASGASARPAYDRIGLASWYGAREAGHRTASGILFDPARLSAAHRKLPLGSCVRVTRLANNKSVVVPVIDRGPFVRGRLLDLSWAAANRLGMIAQGLARVRIERISCATSLPLQILSQPKAI
jgi:rare lipoprotein A